MSIRALVLAALAIPFAAYGDGELAAAAAGDRIDISVGGKLFTSYRFASSQKYPYFYPVNGPRSGKSVTTESSEPYPHHHALFFACDNVNGGNFWQEANESGQTVSQGPAIIEATATRIVIKDECL